MRHVPTLLRRELAAYFLGPMAFLILLAFQFIAWLNFWQLVDALSQIQRVPEFSTLHDPMTRYVSGSMPFWYAVMFSIPALTMRLVAEERRSGTIETLLTVPITETEVIVSKWLAGVVMYWAMLLPFVFYLPFLYFQAKFYFDVGPLITLGVGLTTMGMMFVAIGVFFSTLTRNQIIAAIWTFVSLFTLVLFEYLLYQYAVAVQAPWAEGVRFSAVVFQLRSFGLGQLDVRFLAIHLSVCVFMLYLSIKVLQTRHAK
jgi:ABC-2 type transport system permease protein